MQVFIDNMEITDDMEYRYYNKLSGDKGMRAMTLTVERVTHNFFAKPEYDGKLMRCVTSVPGMGTNETTSVISVDCKYWFLAHPIFFF